MKAYIVTVKLDRAVEHDPKNKRTGTCPFSPTCTDRTGSHHSFLLEAISIEDIKKNLSEMHITRIEEVE